ncbi:L,D-transpeptidase family protein [Bradyrhizobium sp.]|uniref:L,D-transpeptidase n=1 Tax=Bradyrhizobium sp. TaxID=376 RepID=UPI003C65E8BF
MTATGAVGTVSRADASLYYWRDAESGLYRADPAERARYQGERRHSAKKQKSAEKDTGPKPQAPLIIEVSIRKQRLKIYDANGLFAEAPVSTGMPGHATPMGVFSVIQKQKWHESNIYSGAPMPYMQRITWSGIAMHAGVLPGHPASHGCIRMPPGFAVKMYGWTRMGARVVVIPGELSPESFAHPLLPAAKVAPQPVAAAVPADAPPAQKSDKGAADIAPATTEAKLELRTTVGHHDVINASADDASMPLRDQTHTADAGADASDSKSAVTMSDASSSDDASPNTTKARSAGEVAKPLESVGANVKPEQSAASAQAETPKSDTKTDATTDAANAEPAKADAAKPDQSAGKAVDAAPSEADVHKDESRAADAPAAAKPAPKHAGQIAVFISRKDSKLFVRQNFEPLFDVPVTIAASDRPLGTHVFTADVDKTDPNVLHWSVISLPTTARTAMRGENDEHGRHRGKAPLEAKPLPVPDSASEALDRITIPPDTMAWIADAMTTGSSIIVSDQGINQGETGEGTDFIVSLR